MVICRHLLPILMTVLLAMIGCDRSSQWGRVPLSGTASLDGNPFEGGISLRPAGGTKGPSVITDVVDGKFAFNKKSGPVPGPHLAMLIPKSDPSRMMRMDAKVDIPAEAPFNVSLEFTQPAPEAVDTPPPPSDPTGTTGAPK